MIHWPTPVPYASTRDGERKIRPQSQPHLNEMLFWKVTPHKKQGCFSAGSWWVLVPASHRGCSTSREPGSAAGQLCSTRSANNRQTSRTPTAERLCSPTTETALQLSFCYMFSFLWVPALQGSSPLYGGQPG